MASETGEEWRTKGEIENETESIRDKINAGAKALKKKAEDPDKNLRTEYEKEKL